MRIRRIQPILLRNLYQKVSAMFSIFPISPWLILRFYATHRQPYLVTSQNDDCYSDVAVLLTWWDRRAFFPIGHHIFPPQIRPQSIDHWILWLLARQQIAVMFKTDNISRLWIPFFHKFSCSSRRFKANSIWPGVCKKEKYYIASVQRIVTAVHTIHTPRCDCLRTGSPLLQHPWISIFFVVVVYCTSTNGWGILTPTLCFR